MPDFDTAVADSKKLTSKPSNDDLLMLYGLYIISGKLWDVLTWYI
jgi:diazepam-binding inhibitor (GABA receptor modulator, acyl-CoA-binding protein)